MKRIVSKSKLSLAKHTLRQLSAGDLADVGGGSFTLPGTFLCLPPPISGSTVQPGSIKPPGTSGISRCNQQC